MSDVTTEINPVSVETKRRNAWLENFMSTFKLFLKNRIALAGLIITIIYFAIAFLDWVYPQWLGVSSLSSAVAFMPGHRANSLPPTPPNFSGSWWYYFGTTYSRVPILPAMLGCLKVDMVYTIVIVLIGMGTGVLVGSFAGFYGGYIDEVVMRITDIFFSLPFLVFALAFLYVLGFSVTNIVIALIIVWWPTYARLSRGLALETKSLKYIEAATAAGSSRIRSLFSHIIPNVLSPIFVQISLDIGSVIAIFAGIFFLIGSQGNPYYLELGSMIAKATTLGYITVGEWWPVLIPAIFLLVFTVSVNLMGDGLRDVLDPKLRR